MAFVFLYFVMATANVAPTTAGVGERTIAENTAPSARSRLQMQNACSKLDLSPNLYDDNTVHD